MVRRKVPLPESVNDNPDPTVIKAFEDKAMNSSIYAKGSAPRNQAPNSILRPSSLLTDLQMLFVFDATYDKTFKGSVFVEFDSEETQKKFLALDPKPKMEGGGTTD